MLQNVKRDMRSDKQSREADSTIVIILIILNTIYLFI